MIRMINNTGNGYADAYSESEAADLEAKGWARFIPAAPVEPPVEAEPPAPKRGRPFKRAEQ